MQGGYYVKGFAKHGPLHNPYAFGYFDHVPHAGLRGGHVTSGGIIYQGGASPTTYDGKCIARQPAVQRDRLARRRAPPARRSRREYDGDFLGSTDPLVPAGGLRTGPDGASTSPTGTTAGPTTSIPEDTWDKTHGRIYRVGPKGQRRRPPRRSTSRSETQRRTGRAARPTRTTGTPATARRILAERRDPAIVPALKAMVRRE